MLWQICIYIYIYYKYIYVVDFVRICNLSLNCLGMFGPGDEMEPMLPHVTASSWWISPSGWLSNSWSLFFHLPLISSVSYSPQGCQPRVSETNGHRNQVSPGHTLAYRSSVLARHEDAPESQTASGVRCFFLYLDFGCHSNHQHFGCVHLQSKIIQANQLGHRSDSIGSMILVLVWLTIPTLVPAAVLGHSIHSMSMLNWGHWNQSRWLVVAMMFIRLFTDSTETHMVSHRLKPPEKKGLGSSDGGAKGCKRCSL